jgi:hypothetical protein
MTPFLGGCCISLVFAHPLPNINQIYFSSYGQLLVVFTYVGGTSLLAVEC